MAKASRQAHADTPAVIFLSPSEMDPRTFNWDRLSSPSPTTGESLIDFVWFDNSTASRFEKAMRDAGPLSADLLFLFHFLCLEKGIENTEKLLHLPARSGKVLLVPALIRLYKFYQADPKSGVIG